MRGWKFKVLHYAIRVKHFCKKIQDYYPTPQTKGHIFFTGLEPLVISLIVSGASFGANLAISALLAPKQKSQIQGKRSGNIQATDSVFSAYKTEVYGGRKNNEDRNGGVEVGGNVIWASEIRKFDRQVSGGNGGGGKGRPKPAANIERTYKIDMAIAAGVGELRLLRMKWNEDTVYNIFGVGNGETPTLEVERYEAEDAGNTLTGGANIVTDNDCSNNQKVTGIGTGGTLTFNNIAILSNPLVPEPENPTDPESQTYFNIEIKYKSTSGDTNCFVKLDGTGGIYNFPATAGSQIGSRYLIREFTVGTHTLEFSNPNSTGPEIDEIIVSLVELYEPEPTGHENTDFPTELPQDNFLLPDPKNIDTNSFERFNAPAVSIDGVLEVSMPDGASMVWYEGRDDQPIDPIIAADVDAKYGTGSTPAFEGTAYGRIKDMDLTKYGSFPSVRMVVENVNTKTVEEISLARASAIRELTTDDFELDTSSDMHVRGHFVNSAKSPADTMAELALLHNITFIENNDGVIKAIDLSDRSVKYTFTEDELEATTGESEDIDDVSSVIPNDTQGFIKEFQLQFINPTQPSDYATDQQSFTYPYSTSDRKEQKQIDATLTEKEAINICKREVQKSLVQAIPHAVTIPYSSAFIDIGDVVEIPIDGELKKVRIHQKTGASPGVYELALLSEDINTAVGDSTVMEVSQKPYKTTVKVPANTIGTLIDIPALEDAQDRKGVYVAACPKPTSLGAVWQGAGIYRKKADEFQMMTTFTKQATMGRAVTALGASPGENVLDTIGFTVDFYGDKTPESVTDDQSKDDGGAWIIGNEVVNIQTWTRDNNFPNRWTATNIYKKSGNSKEKYTTEHVVDERVVFIDDALKFIPLDAEEKDVTRDWKFVTSGQNIEHVGEISFQWKAENDFNLETDKPIIGQLFDAEQSIIKIGVKNFTSKSISRKIEISSNPDMSSANEKIISQDKYAHSRMSNKFTVSRPTSETANKTWYVRVSHSSNGFEFGEPSNILTITFANSSKAGGTSGDFSLEEELILEVDTLT